MSSIRKRKRQDPAPGSERESRHPPLDHSSDGSDSNKSSRGQAQSQRPRGTVRRRRAGGHPLPAPICPPGPAALHEGESVAERARPFLLAVARMPLGVLDTTWSIGRNRPINPAHVRELECVFSKVGLERCAPEHRLRLLCSAADVRRMRAAASRRGYHAGDEEASSFLDWASVNTAGDRVEVMAGQHRIHALRAYVARTGSPDTELWWTCELYDKGVCADM